MVFHPWPIKNLSKRISGGILATVLGGLLLSVCFFAPVSPASANPEDRRIVRIAADKAFPPYIFSAAAGRPAGFEVELLQLVEQDTRLKFIWTLTESGNVLSLLQSNQVDLISSVNIPEARKMDFMFSRPYLQSKAILFVAADNYHIQSIDSLAGNRVGIRQGAFSEYVAMQSTYPLNLSYFPNSRELLQAVADRKIDAAISDAYAGYYFLYQLQLEQSVKAMGTEIFSQSFSFAARQNDADVLQIINASLERLQAGGKIDALQEKWFGKQNLFFGLSREELRYYAASALAAILLIVSFAFFFIFLLRRKVAQGTAKIAGQRDELQKAYQEMAAQNEELLAQDEMLGQQNLLLQASEETFRLAVEASNDILFDWDLATNRFSCAERWAERFGVPATGETFSMSRLLERVHPEDREVRSLALSRHLQGLAPYFICEYRLRTADGGYFWVKSRGKAVKDHAGIPTRIVGAITDINEAKLREERISTLAYFDPLTGLPNRASFMERLRDELAEENARGSLLLIDLDNFKFLNDSMGHDCGDALLCELGHRLLDVAGRTNMVARISGDEFVVFLLHMADIPTVEAFARQLTQTMTQPFIFAGQKLFCTISIGIVRYPEDGTDSSKLFRDADTALHNAKEEGKNTFRFFTGWMRERIFQRMSIESGLRQALQNNELLLHYQPIVDTQNSRIVGLEALVRWNSPEHGSVPPLTFIPVAEETGRIIPIGRWVLQTACLFMKNLSQQGFPSLFIAVNISARQIYQTNFVSEVKAILQETGLPPSQLELEITESVLIDSFEQNVSKLLELKELGVKIALDDFGTGYSSLTYLKNLPIHKLKIDKSFVDDLAEGGPNAAILDAIVHLSRCLELKVVAEGVETPIQKAELTRHGCVLMQGFLFSAAIPAEEIRETLESGSKGQLT